MNLRAAPLLTLVLLSVSLLLLCIAAHGKATDIDDWDEDEAGDDALDAGDDGLDADLDDELDSSVRAPRRQQRPKPKHSKRDKKTRRHADPSAARKAKKPVKSHITKTTQQTSTKAKAALSTADPVPKADSTRSLDLPKSSGVPVTAAPKATSSNAARTVRKEATEGLESPVTRGQSGSSATERAPDHDATPRPPVKPTPNRSDRAPETKASKAPPTKSADPAPVPSSAAGAAAIAQSAEPQTKPSRPISQDKDKADKPSAPNSRSDSDTRVPKAAAPSKDQLATADPLDSRVVKPQGDAKAALSKGPRAAAVTDIDAKPAQSTKSTESTVKPAKSKAEHAQSPPSSAKRPAGAKPSEVNQRAGSKPSEVNQRAGSKPSKSLDTKHPSLPSAPEKGTKSDAKLKQSLATEAAAPPQGPDTLPRAAPSITRLPVVHEGSEAPPTITPSAAASPDPLSKPVAGPGDLRSEQSQTKPSSELATASRPPPLAEPSPPASAAPPLPPTGPTVRTPAPVQSPESAGSDRPSEREPPTAKPVLEPLPLASNAESASSTPRAIVSAPVPADPLLPTAGVSVFQSSPASTSASTSTSTSASTSTSTSASTGLGPVDSASPQLPGADSEVITAKSAGAGSAAGGDAKSDPSDPASGETHAPSPNPPAERPPPPTPPPSGASTVESARPRQMPSALESDGALDEALKSSKSNPLKDMLFRRSGSASTSSDSASRPSLPRAAQPSPAKLRAVAEHILSEVSAAPLPPSPPPTVSIASLQAALSSAKWQPDPIDEPDPVPAAPTPASPASDSVPTKNPFSSAYPGPAVDPAADPAADPVPVQVPASSSWLNWMNSQPVDAGEPVATVLEVEPESSDQTQSVSTGSRFMTQRQKAYRALRYLGLFLLVVVFVVVVVCRVRRINSEGSTRTNIPKETDDVSDVEMRALRQRKEKNRAQFKAN